jgi:hypothetical protein
VVVEVGERVEMNEARKICFVVNVVQYNMNAGMLMTPKML